MTRAAAFGVGTILAFLGAAPALAVEQDGRLDSAGSAPTDRVIVQWASSADRADRVDARADAEVTFQRTLGDPDFQLVRTEPGQSVGGAIDALEADPAVAVAERDGYSVPQAVPDDPLFDDLWGLSNTGAGVDGFTGALAGADIDVLGAWTRTVGSPSTIVAVIDSGYRFDHPDLAAVATGNGFDFVGNSADVPTTDSDPTDDNVVSGGHGVHTAGTIGAAGDNGVGITGVGQNLRIMPLRVCAHSVTNGDARCPYSSQVAAINYAGVNGARVANISLGGTSFQQTVVNAIAANPQTLFVISAGNDGSDNDGGGSPPAGHHYPCDFRPTMDASPAVPGAIDNIVCVAATDQADQLASFSDWGPTSVDLGAPGTETLSTYRSYTWDTFVDDDFQTNDFSTKWSATGVNGGFARSSESPLTSLGMTDTSGSEAAANTVREVTSAAVTLPAGYTGCKLLQQRNVSLPTPANGASYRYSVVLNGVEIDVVSQTTSSNGSFQRLINPLTLAVGGSLQVRFRYSSGSAPVAGNGVWLDDIALECTKPSLMSLNYTYLQGTSMAAPHVTGTAGLMFSLKPAATVTEVRNALLASVDAIPALAGKTTTGGRLNASEALDAFDVVAPAAPQLESSDPPSPGNSNTPKIKGSAEEFSTVRLYSGAGCGGSPVATVSAEVLASTGASVPGVGDNSTTTYSARATDTASNASSCSASFGYVEDSIPPATTIDSGPNSYVLDTQPAFDFSSEAGAGFECAIGSGDVTPNAPGFGACSGPGATHKPTTGLAAGPYTFRVRAVDLAGNPDPTPATRGFGVGPAPVLIVDPPFLPDPSRTVVPAVDLPGPGAACIVPKLTGKTLAQAKKALGATRCALGKVTKPKRSRGKRLIVKSSKPGAGASHVAGTKIDLTMKVKPKPKRKRR